MKSMLKWLSLVTVTAVVVLPLMAIAQTAAADPSLDWIGPLAEKALAYVPTKYMPLVLVAWWIGYYVAAPLVKAFVKPDGTAVRGWAIRFVEWFTQDTHRPPPLAKKVQEQPSPYSDGTNAAPKGFVSLALVAAILAGAIALAPGVARGQTAPVLADWTAKFGPVTVIPSASVTPLLVSLKTWSTSEGPNVGVGLDVLWPNGYGFSPHVAARETAVGTRPLASVFAVLPPIARFGIRPGVLYQFQGGAAPWRDGFMLGISGAANLSLLLGMK